MSAVDRCSRVAPGLHEYCAYSNSFRPDAVVFSRCLFAGGAG